MAASVLRSVFSRIQTNDRRPFARLFFTRSTHLWKTNSDGYGRFSTARPPGIGWQRVAGTPAEQFFPRVDGGEMWSRWDMQENPPDILITNYSMLNIMLMRSVESNIFDLTRQWLEGDRSRVFHLIVDELHTYRGTPGTEVAYLIRVLLGRLGLSPESPQLRIIASSASLP